MVQAPRYTSRKRPCFIQEWSMSGFRSSVTNFVWPEVTVHRPETSVGYATRRALGFTTPCVTLLIPNFFGTQCVVRRALVYSEVLASSVYSRSSTTLMLFIVQTVHWWEVLSAKKPIGTPQSGLPLYLFFILLFCFICDLKPIVIVHDFPRKHDGIPVCTPYIHTPEYYGVSAYEISASFITTNN